MADGEIIAAEEARAVAPRPSTPMEMIGAALERGADIDVLDKLMSLQERWEKNQARKAFDAAIAEAKAEIPTIKKNRHVGFESKSGGARTDYRHEDFAEVARTVNPVLGRYGLSYRFRVESPVDGPVIVTCVLSHRDGYFEETTLHAGRDTSGNKNSIQSIGSTVTYLQRYTLKAALGLAAENDDDGQASGGDEAVTEEQRDAILEMISATNSNVEKFCAYMKVEAVADIRQRDFKAAIAALESAAKAKKSRGGRA